MKPQQFILASTSPRRRELLQAAGYSFTVVAPPMEEPAGTHARLSPARLAEALAYFKARSVAVMLKTDLPVLGADTVVALGDRTYGKPADADQARRILRELGGTRHAVITGLALILPDGRRVIDSDTTHVTMRAMSPQQLESYIASGAWEGKAGAYGIQDSGDELIERIEGSFTNVVGLPMELLQRMFELVFADPTRTDQEPA